MKNKIRSKGIGVAFSLTLLLMVLIACSPAVHQSTIEEAAQSFVVALMEGDKRVLDHFNRSAAEEGVTTDQLMEEIAPMFEGEVWEDISLTYYNDQLVEAEGRDQSSFLFVLEEEEDGFYFAGYPTPEQERDFFQMKYYHLAVPESHPSQELIVEKVITALINQDYETLEILIKMDVDQSSFTMDSMGLDFSQLSLSDLEIVPQGDMRVDVHHVRGYFTATLQLFREEDRIYVIDAQIEVNG